MAHIRFQEGRDGPIMYLAMATLQAGAQRGRRQQACSLAHWMPLDINGWPD